MSSAFDQSVQLFNTLWGSCLGEDSRRCSGAETVTLHFCVKGGLGDPQGITHLTPSVTEFLQSFCDPLFLQLFHQRFHRAGCDDRIKAGGSMAGNGTHTLRSLIGEIMHIELIASECMDPANLILKLANIARPVVREEVLLDFSIKFKEKVK